MGTLHAERADGFWGVTNPGGFATGTDFPTTVPAVLSPDAAGAGQGVAAAADGVIPFGHNGLEAARHLRLLPIGVGTPGQTFQMKVYGWCSTAGTLLSGAKRNAQPLWVPELLGAFAVTLGALTGVAGCDLDPSVSLAANIIPTFWPTTPAPSLVVGDWMLHSPNNGVDAASLTMRVVGPRFVEVVYRLVTAAGANALYKKL